MAAEPTSAEGRPHHPRPDRSAIPAVDIALPVHNEERLLAASVERLYDHLTEHFPYSWQITIAENGSTDGTRLIGQRLASELREVRFVSMKPAGRGGALRRVWSESASEVLAYMDIDLSTDLAALTRLVAPLTSDDADIAIGSRLSPESRVSRSPRREVLSRGLHGGAQSGVPPPFSRRAVRVQGAARRCGEVAPPPRGRRRLVLRHRAACSSRATWTCGCTRCRLSGSKTATAGCASPAPCGTTSRVLLACTDGSGRTRSDPSAKRRMTM